MHEWITTGVAPRTWPANVFEKLIGHAFDLLWLHGRVGCRNCKQTELRSARIGKERERRAAATGRIVRGTISKALPEIEDADSGGFDLQVLQNGGFPGRVVLRHDYASCF